MATAALISVSEYLNTTYRPDCDYVDGEVLERNLGEMPHSILQGYFWGVFNTNRKLWGLRPLTEQRVQTSATRFRIPDVCVVRPERDADPIVRTAPFLCIEIYSPRDTAREMQERVADYLALGVEHIWLVHPAKRLAWIADADGFHPLTADSFTIAGTSIRVEIAALWAELDDMAAGRLS